jgi:glutathione reductase (NADPH)
MKKSYDVFVIGTGSAGKKVAYACAAEGMSVAIADHVEYGGTCANRGCDPKKVLVGVTKAMQTVENLKGKGIEQEVTIDWKELQTFKDTFIDAVPAATEKALKKAGIEMYHQSPVFLDDHTLSVEGKTVKAEKIVIASGMKPLELKIPGREHLLTSEDFLNLPELPEEIVFVGAGYIGMEFAHIAARCGTKVTVIEFQDRILGPFDADLSSALRKASEELGIRFILKSEVVEVEKIRTNFRVIYKRSNKKESIKAKAVFNTAGRVPSIDMLSLDKGNIESSKHGITVNEYLQSNSNSKVYACGDVSASGSLPLTPFASIEGQIVANNIIEGNSQKLDIPPTPSVVFTIPQLASIGLTQEEAEKEYDVEVIERDASRWYNAKRLNESTYALKFIFNAQDQTLLGSYIRR